MINKLRYPKILFSKQEVKAQREKLAFKNLWKFTEDKKNYWLIMRT